MHPFLIEIPGTSIRIASYGFMLASGFLAAYYLLSHYVKKVEPESVEAVTGIFPWVIVSSLIGARLFHVFFERPGYYFDHPVAVFHVWNGGYTFYGGLIAAIVASYIYCKKQNLSFAQVADYATPSIAFAQGMARIGCFLAGCCWGKECELPWAVTFTHPESLAGIKHIPVHPAQIYQSVGNFIVFGALIYFRKKKRFDGETLFWYAVLYSIVRSVVEVFRADEYRGFVLGDFLSTSQFISLIISLISIAFLVRGKKIEFLDTRGK